VDAFNRIAHDVKLGRDVDIFCFVNLYGCTIGDCTRIGSFVEIQRNAMVGARCKLSSYAFVCEGVTIEGRAASCSRRGESSPGHPGLRDDELS
jgi:UDP-3-O-[3-hydroxymyristoyl] glucosamine N-acyltransferase